MKRITVSLPDALADDVKRAAGGVGQVSAYVTAALADYQERESLADILADWTTETPVPDEVRAAVADELDAVGMTKRPRR